MAATGKASTGPLHGVRVLEIEAIGPVPWAGMMLSDMGADVLRIDRPVPHDLGVARDVRFQVVERGRRSLVADLKDPQARDALLCLVARADVLLEGMRPGVMERLGLGPDACLARNPALVYGRMTGWGQDGPMAQTVGHDINYIAASGVLHAIGGAATPVPPLNLVGDYGGGAMLLLSGVLAALLHARAGGQGQVVDAAMVDGARSLMAPFWGRLAAGEWQDRRQSNLLDGGAHFYGVYETQDGKHVAVGAIEPRFYAALLKGLALDPATLPQQHDRTAWPGLREAFAAIFKTRTRDQWCVVFDGTEACVSPVLSMREVPSHPQHAGRDGFVQAGGVPHPAPAPRFSRTPSAIAGPPPQRGGGGAAALADWGFAADDPLLAALRGTG